MRPIVNRFPDAQATAAGAASALAERIAALSDTQDRVNIVLTGGTVGILTLAKLRELSVDYSKVHFWWGDERYVASDSPDRNELQARTALLDHIEVTEAQIHAFPAADSGLSLDEAATEFRKSVAGVEFDVLLLGVGPDGHIASLFPGKNAQGVDVVAEHDSPKPPPQRLSLSYDAIRRAKEVWFTVAGADKQDAVLSAFSDNPEELPVGRVHGTEKTVWFVDSTAGVKAWGC